MFKTKQLQFSRLSTMLGPQDSHAAAHHETTKPAGTRMSQCKEIQGWDVTSFVTSKHVTNTTAILHNSQISSLIECKEIGALILCMPSSSLGRSFSTRFHNGSRLKDNVLRWDLQCVEGHMDFIGFCQVCIHWCLKPPTSPSEVMRQTCQIENQEDIRILMEIECFTPCFSTATSHFILSAPHPQGLLHEKEQQFQGQWWALTA